MAHDGGSGLRTRSKVAPDWTVQESLTLVNEIAAVEADCRDTLSSFQKWKIIVENCNALDLNRSLNQCRRKWDSLLSDYKTIKQSRSKKASFNSELFKAIELHVTESEGGYDTEPDSPKPPPPPPPPLAAFEQSGSKNQRTKIITPDRKHIVKEKAKPTIEVEERSSDPDGHTNASLDEKINREEHEEKLAENLRENAQLIEAIVKEQMDEDLINGDNSPSDLTRMNADEIITCLSNLAVTIDELRKLQKDSME